MTTEIRGSLDGTDLRVGIVVARYNEFVTSRLLEGAKAALAQHGVTEGNITVVSVPGSFEVSFAAKKLSESSDVDVVICLGAVIRGETDHYEHIARATAEGVREVGLSSGKPAVFGILTTENDQQALDRAGGKSGNHGHGAAVTAIEMANLCRSLNNESA